jgi:hypothetical protein
MRKLLLPLCASVSLLCLSSITTYAEDAAKPPVAEASPEKTTTSPTPVIPKEIKVEVVGSPAVIANDENTFKIKLTDESGNPITPEQLKTDEKNAIRVFINEQTLNDYANLSPAPTKEKGTWSFIITPCRPTSYKGWTKVTTADGQVHYVTIDLPGASPCVKDCIRPRTITEGEGWGIKATLLFNQPLKVGQEAFGAIHLTDKMTGKPVIDLQPIKGEFAQITAFSNDFNTMIHIEPDGEDPKDDKSRGGPDISFPFKPLKAGYTQFYLQMHHNDKDAYIMFGVNVEE